MLTQSVDFFGSTLSLFTIHHHHHHRYQHAQPIEINFPFPALLYDVTVQVQLSSIDPSLLSLLYTNTHSIQPTFSPQSVICYLHPSLHTLTTCFLSVFVRAGLPTVTRTLSTTSVKQDSRWFERDQISSKAQSRTSWPFPSLPLQQLPLPIVRKVPIPFTAPLIPFQFQQQ